MRIIGTGLNRPDSTQLRALQLGYVGLLPFALAALLVWLFPASNDDALVSNLFGWILIYGALILSFLAGSHWGMAIREWRPGRLLVAIIPVLIAWVATLPDDLIAGVSLDLDLRYGVLLLGLVLMLIIEIAAQMEWAPWYKALRIRLTLLAGSFVLLTILGLVR